MKWFTIKPIVNKANNQINISLPKKELPSELLKDIHTNKKIEITFKGRKLK
ncbi:MAG: hypothetical protein ABSG05_03480 [Candidatus Pacearchaeota archaeon]|jgi:hypothetical protein